MCQSGAMVATAAGSRRQLGLRTPNTTSAAARKPPRRHTACRAAARSPRSSASGGRPHAAPYRPAAVPAAAPSRHRWPKLTGSLAMRAKRVLASAIRPPATALRLASPATATTPRSRMVVPAASAGVCAASQRRNSLVLANCRLFLRFSSQPMAVSNSSVTTKAPWTASAASPASSAPARIHSVKSST
eukprot:2519067-Pyramimonas_sp.AAC.1